MRAHRGWTIGLAAGALGVVGILAGALGVRAQGAASSYLPVTEEDFTTVLARMRAGKAAVMKRQMDLLGARYDLSDRPAAGVTMSRGKAVQDGASPVLPAQREGSHAQIFGPARDQVGISDQVQIALYGRLGRHQC